MLVACQKNHAEVERVGPMRNMRILMAVVAIAPLLVLSGCFPSIGDIIGGGGGGSPASVSGKWSTSLSSSKASANSFDLEVNISQATASISASPAVILSNASCEAGTDSLDGTVKSNQVSFTLSFGTGSPTITFSGTVSSNGLTMSGNYKVPSGNCTPADSGTWVATKFGDSSDAYSGPLTSAVTSRTFTMAAVVQENAANNLQVTANLTGANCVVLNLTGLAIGSVLQLENSDGTITLMARAPTPDYATLNAEYTFTGKSCGTEDNGKGTLSKTAANVVVRSGEKSAISPETHMLFEKARQALESWK
jgi:hypothetical protein